MKPQKAIAAITALNVFLSSISSSYAMIRGDEEKEDGPLSDYRPDNRLHASSAHAESLPDEGPSSPVHLHERESRLALTPLEAPSSMESPYAVDAAPPGWGGVVLVDPDSIASAESQESWEERQKRDAQVHEAIQSRRVYEADERLAQQLSMELNNAPQQRNGIADKDLDWKHSEDTEPNRGSYLYDDDGEERKSDYVPDDYSPTPSAHAAALPYEGPSSPVHLHESEGKLSAHLLEAPSPLSAQRDFIDRELNYFRDEVIQKTKARQDIITPLVERINKLIPATSPEVQVKLKSHLSLRGDFSLVSSVQDNPVTIQAVQPAALTIPAYRERFLGDQNPSLDHFFLSPLMITLKSIRSLVHDPLLQGGPLAIELGHLANLYEEAAKAVCDAKGSERRDLLSLVRLRLERSHHSYFISEPMAYKILSLDSDSGKDELGLVKRVNDTGSTAVMPFKDLHFKRNFKKAHLTEHAMDYYRLLQDDNLAFEGTLDPGMEWGMYTFYTLLMGGGVTPSSLIVLQDVPQLVPKEGTRPYNLLANILYPPNSEQEKKKALKEIPLCLTGMDDFTRNLKEHAVQVSRTVPGVDLAAFLKEGNQNFDHKSFSAMMLASLLTAASDAKGDNFIVMQEDGKSAIVGIDNDAALDPFIARHTYDDVEQKASHAQPDVPPASKYSYTVEARNILFCLHDWMGKSVDQTIQQRLLDISPHAFVVEWLSLLKEQNNRYISLTTEGKLHPVTFRNLYLPLRIQAGSLTHLTNNIVRLQEALRLDSSLTHQAAFELLSPVSALYYQEMAGRYGKDPLVCFPPIYNQHKPVEKALDLQQQLKDGRTIEEALESEKYSKGGASNRHQVLSEGIQSLLETTDLTDLEEKTKVGFLKAAFQYFPNQTRRVHSSWKDPHLVHEAIRHQAPLPLLGCLIDKNPDALVDEGIGDSLLHTAIRYENSQTSAYTPFLLEKGVSLESLNSQYLTPLDLAMSLRNEHLFSMLVGLGAGKRANVTIAMKFFKALGEDSPAREAFNHLLERNQEIAWHVTLNDMLPPVSKGSEGLVVQTATLGERRLVLHDQLFDEKGAIRPSVKNGRHKVGSVDQKGGSILYFKEYPELPGLEEAVGILTRRIMGVGAPFTELAKIHNRPFLISQGIQGNLLSSVLKGTPHILKQLDPESLSAMIVMAILTNPEDGKPDNYIVERLPGNNNTYRLIGIDNDHAFVPAVAKEKKSVFSRADPIVQVKTILYCLDQMNDKVHSSVQEKIKALNAGTVLEEWIRALRPRNSLYRQLFPTGERGDALAHNSYLSVPFQKGAIGRLYQKIVRLQDFLGHNPNLTHMELLSKIEPQLAHRYRQGFKKPMTVNDRFKIIDGPFYRQDSDGHHHTISKSGDILWSMDIPLKESLLEIARKQDAKEDDYQPNMALKELKTIRGNYGKIVLLKNPSGAELLQSSGTLKGLLPDELMRLVKNIDFASLSVSQQDALLEILKGKDFTQLTLLNASSLTSPLLMADIPLEKLLSINLSGAERLTPEILPAFAGRSIGLEYLNLSRIRKLTAFAEPGIFKNYPLVFPNLKSFYLDQTAITGIYVQAPLLEVLSAQKCPQLETLSVEAPLLKEAFLGNNSALSFEVLSSLLTGCPRLSTLAIENCVKIGLKGIKLPFEEGNVKKALAYFKAAIQGNAAAQNNLGALYDRGQWVPQDYIQARKWWEKAAAQGNASAQCDLGALYYTGHGVPQDYIQAREWLEKSVAQGYARAQVCIGVLYYTGDGVPQDYVQARKWWEKAAAQGNADAQRGLGGIYRDGQGVPQDYAQAREWYEKAAAQGDDAAQARLGDLYRVGKGVAQDYVQARGWYGKAAAQGNADAQYWLGDFYRDGNGVPQDYAQAREWYEKAAAQGNAWAQNNLGNLYYNGKVVPQDYAQAKEWYEKAAAQGNAWAQNNLGNLYYDGQGVLQDYVQAKEWYEKAAAKGNASAQGILGVFYYHGQGVAKDYAQAREWFEKAAAQGHAIAQCGLGALYLDGKGVPQDYAQAKAWIEKAVAQGNAEAQYGLGNLYWDGRGVLQDYVQAKEWYEKAAAQGAADAQNSLGDLYRDGKGAPQDYIQAKKWYEKAAAQGNATAQDNLGDLYRDGKGVPQDYIQAKEWYEKAAAQGDANAQYSLGMRYYNGQGVAQDYVQAREWFEKTAAQGNATAQNNLGGFYRDGEGVAQDYAQAKEWYEKAAAQENASAQNNLGGLYYNGRGVLQDYAQAREWYEKAAAQGNTNAQANLAALYEDGQGVPQDYVQAMEWYEKAAAQGNTSAQNNLGNLYRKGLGGQQDYVQAREWYEKAVAQGIAVSQSNLADLYRKGQGVEKDLQQSYLLFQKAFQMIQKESEDKLRWNQRTLGYLYYYGRGVDQDYAQAYEWHRKAAEQKDLWSCISLARLYKEGHGTERNLENALYWLTQAQENKNNASEALYNLAVMYRDGEGVEQNDVTAVELFQEAIKSFNKDAFYALGWMYDHGRGVAYSREDGQKYYQEGETRHAEEALYDLGRMYEYGLGVPQDMKQALFWYEKAAEKGYEIACAKIRDSAREAAVKDVDLPVS